MAVAVRSRAGSTLAFCACMARSGHRLIPPWATRARVAPIFARARVVPAGGNGGGLERAGELTPYEIQLLVADALRAGPGARLEMELAASTDDAGLATTRKRFAWLAGRGVAISVQRDHRAV